MDAMMNQKKPPQPRKLSGYFLAIYWATVYR